jgi:hypothetical protein
MQGSDLVLGTALRPFEVVFDNFVFSHSHLSGSYAAQ